MPYRVVEYELPVSNRTQMRQSLILCFLSEEAGTGSGERASHYQYNVEQFKDYRIYLRRPTQLNKGFDFTVNIDGIYFKKNRRYSNPSHQDVFDALACCQGKYQVEYDAVKDAIIKIYNCISVDLSQINAFFCDFEGTEHPIQIILLAIKWLFMEQDCAYWNYSGRRMLYEGLRKRELV